MVHLVMPTKVGIHVFGACQKDVDGGPSPAMTLGRQGHLKCVASVIIGPSDIEPSSLYP
jgi:hypothetical protein